MTPQSTESEAVVDEYLDHTYSNSSEENNNNNNSNGGYAAMYDQHSSQNSEFKAEAKTPAVVDSEAEDRDGHHANSLYVMQNYTSEEQQVSPPTDINPACVRELNKLLVIWGNAVQNTQRQEAALLSLRKATAWYTGIEDMTAKLGVPTPLVFALVGSELFTSMFDALIGLLTLPELITKPLTTETQAVISAVLRLLAHVLEGQNGALFNFQPVARLLATTLMIFRLSETHYSTLHALAAQIMSILAEVSNPVMIVSSLSRVIVDPVLQREGALLKYSIRMVSAVTVLLTQQELARTIDSLLAGLNNHINNSNAVIRMAVIACFVSMHTVLGDNLFDHLTGLNVVQIKLIRIYIRKHKEKATTKV
jgi:hypothetical protein